MLGQIDVSSPGLIEVPDTTDSTAIACMPAGWDGPLAPGQSWCVASAATPTPAVCPAGATCTIVPGISNNNIYLAIAAVAALFAGMAMFGGHHR